MLFLYDYLLFNFLQRLDLHFLLFLYARFSALRFLTAFRFAHFVFSVRSLFYFPPYCSVQIWPFRFFYTLILLFFTLFQRLIWAISPFLYAHYSTFHLIAAYKFDHFAFSIRSSFYSSLYSSVQIWLFFLFCTLTLTILLLFQRLDLLILYFLSAYEEFPNAY